MNWDAIGAVGEILGAVLVLATLIYLARQISQSVELGRATQNRAIMESYESFNNVIISNRESAELLAKMESTTGDLSPADTVQIRHLGYRFINIYFSVHTSYSSGQLSREEYDAYKNDCQVIFETYPGLLRPVGEIWKRYAFFQAAEIFAPVREYLKSAA